MKQLTISVFHDVPRVPCIKMERMECQIMGRWANLFGAFPFKWVTHEIALRLLYLVTVNHGVVCA